MRCKTLLITLLLTFLVTVTAMSMPPHPELLEALEKENRRLQQKLKQAELIIEAQKKMSEILGIAQNMDESTENK